MTLFFIIAGTLFLGFFYRQLFNGIGKIWTMALDHHHPLKSSQAPIPISLVIAYRNESKNLQALCDSIQKLHYPAQLIDIIWVDDHSEDTSTEFIQNTMKDAQVSQQFIRCVGSGKKASVQQGILAARHEWILLTDADIILPVYWIESMMAELKLDTSAICGPVRFTAVTSFLERWMQLDFSALVSTGAAYLEAGTPVMANGANMLIRKSVYLRALEDMQGTSFTSGDDVFLIQTFHKLSPNSVSFCYSKNAMVLTKGPENFTAFIQQRIRWASKAPGYQNKESIFLSVFVFVYHTLALSTLALSFFNEIFVPVFLILFWIKYFTDKKFFSRILSFYDIPFDPMFVLKSEFMQLIYIPLVGLLSPWYRVKWKGRRI
jgi:cellulose synthase/poly-beta-1,6-N-acetylglucosamine synthase-like glycosyltransferase